MSGRYSTLGFLGTGGGTLAFLRSPSAPLRSGRSSSRLPCESRRGPAGVRDKWGSPRPLLSSPLRSTTTASCGIPFSLAAVPGGDLGDRGPSSRRTGGLGRMHGGRLASGGFSATGGFTFLSGPGQGTRAGSSVCSGPSALSSGSERLMERRRTERRSDCVTTGMMGVMGLVFCASLVPKVESEWCRLTFVFPFREIFSPERSRWAGGVSGRSKDSLALGLLSMGDVGGREDFLSGTSGLTRTWCGECPRTVEVGTVGVGVSD